MSPSGNLDVATLGEAMTLLVAAEAGPLERVHTFHKCTAGAETNVAIGLARLGLKVGWASRLGADSMGRYLLRSMHDEGIDCSKVLIDADRRTGFMFKSRVNDGSDPSTEYYRAGSAASQMTEADVDADWLRKARHLHVTGVFPALSEGTLAATRKAIETMRAAGRTISFDPNLRPTLWSSPQAMCTTLNTLAAACDWVLPGLQEGAFLTGRTEPEGIAGHFRERGARLVVVKLGPGGAYFDGETGRGHVAAFPVARVIDTVGAGDGFAVGILSALLEGRTIADAVRRGAWIGARVVQAWGDTEGLPTHEQMATAGF